MTNRAHTILVLALIFACAAAAADRRVAQRANEVLGGPQKGYPYLCKGLSKQNLLDLPSYQPWGILHSARQGTDVVHIIAVRVQFQIDSSELTTGNGLFGIGQDQTPNQSDRKEVSWYGLNWQGSGPAPYTYDDLPHDYGYFASQLTFVQKYFTTVSHGKLFVDFTLFPPGPSYGNPPQVPKTMVYYSPGAKKPKETWDEYYYRRTAALMEFIRDALEAADKDGSAPFASLRQDPATGILYMRDSTGAEQKAAILIIHAGASYLTDGGYLGSLGQDSPSDMIDAFISPDFFDYFKDTVNFDSSRVGSAMHRGVKLTTARGPVLVNEVMMVSETSNQDSLNWGIHGILVNQVGRQIGLPNLDAGQSEIGSFCIMDVAGYSSGQGFIPPWPCAWVRAFMGWETPVVANINSAPSTYTLTAVSAAKPGDTTILLVPLNDHEYYLIENRQRNLSPLTSVFTYDTFVVSATDTQVYIDPYNPLNLKANVLATGASHTIDSVQNFDASVAASGILVWHVDENLVRDRLASNTLNTDSLYKAVSLVEADGINDIGVQFSDVLGQATFDYGGAEDVFPHVTIDKAGGNVTVSGFGPFTRPSTQSNDGGQTYLSLSFQRTGRDPLGANAVEESEIRGYYVSADADSAFRVTVGRDQRVPAIDGWPKRMLPGLFLEPALCNVYGVGDTLDLAVLDTSGRLYVWPALGNGSNSLGSRQDSVLVISLRGDTLQSSDTAGRYSYSFMTYLRKIPQPASFPTTVKGALYVPSRNGTVYVLEHILSPTNSDSAQWDSLALPAAASSYVCNYDGSSNWAVGCADGSIVFGTGTSISHTMAPPPGQASPVVALALLRLTDTTLAAIHANGMLVTCRPGGSAPLAAKQVLGGLAPYTLVTGDLNAIDADPSPDIVVCDSRQGLWMFSTHGDTLGLAPQWDNSPNDWASIYHYGDTKQNQSDRHQFPVNGSAPSLADIDGDGALEILVGGTNGVFALNYKGVPLTNWPSYLDNRYWYQRGSVMASPVVGIAPGSVQPRLLFSSPTGENITFGVAKIDSASRKRGIVYFHYSNGTPDSVPDLTQLQIDTLLVLGDSVVLPYIAPGGYVDALTPAGKRPDTLVTLAGLGSVRQSFWPLSAGGSMSTSPLLCDMDHSGKLDLIAISNSGAAYRFKLDPQILPDSTLWPQAGFNSSRAFAYLGPLPKAAAAGSPRIEFFYNYPNPAAGLDETVFRFKFSAAASDARLDIYTYTGFHAYTHTFSSAELAANFPGSNEHSVSLTHLGPGVYRCRLAATVGGTKQVQYWKMAVVK